MANRYRIGNAQTIGRREIQSNYFSTSNNKSGNLLAVLADGTIDHPNGRRAAIMAVESCVSSFLAANSYSAQFLSELALNANKRIQDEIYLDKNPRLSLTLCLFEGKNLHYFSVGANRIYLYDGLHERVIGSGADRSYSSGKYVLSSRDTVGIFTAGAYANANPMERIKIIGSAKKVFDKAQAIIRSILEKDLNNQINATALLIEVVK